MDLTGLIEVCPANASYMLHFDPDLIEPDTLIAKLKDLDREIHLSEYEWDSAHHRLSRSL